MSPSQFLATIMRPGLDTLSAVAAHDMSSDRALVLLLAIAMQESNLEYRRQIGGPARGWWQFESGGGVKGVLEHHSSSREAVELCGRYCVPPTRSVVYEALAWHDGLSTGFARLLLWTDPAPLPAVGDVGAGWACYLRNWRPGKPHPERWETLYPRAVQCVTGIVAT